LRGSKGGRQQRNIEEFGKTDAAPE
jgi:hypothetical protein